MRYRCRDHGIQVEIAGDRGQHRRVQLPPPVTPQNRRNPEEGIHGECVLLILHPPEAGELPRRSPDGRPLQGVCHVEEVP